jgi:hypothetical protein
MADLTLRICFREGIGWSQIITIVCYVLVTFMRTMIMSSLFATLVGGFGIIFKCLGVQIVLWLNLQVWREEVSNTAIY